MRARVLLALLAACAVSATAVAETVVINGQVHVAPTTLPHPHRSQTMRQVEQRFGRPEKRYAAVGRPPITRWDYRNFSVFFEYNRVVHAVMHAPQAE
ncbi:MAG: hypothetical protein ACP5P4_07510 [Steroidobacteraceae bacterium]